MNRVEPSRWLTRTDRSENRFASHVARSTCNLSTNPYRPGEDCFIWDLEVDASHYGKRKKIESANVVILGGWTCAFEQATRSRRDDTRASKPRFKPVGTRLPVSANEPAHQHSWEALAGIGPTGPQEIRAGCGCDSRTAAPRARWLLTAVMPLIPGGPWDVRCPHPAKDLPGAAGSFFEIEGDRTMITRSKHPRKNVGRPIHSCIPMRSISIVESMTSKIESHPK